MTPVQYPPVRSEPPAGYWQIYDRCMEKAREGMLKHIEKHTGHLTTWNGIHGKNSGRIQRDPPDWAAPWLHLADAVSRGTILPLHAIQALNMGYLFSPLELRESAYTHLLT